MPTREQIKAARALLDWSQKDLAAHCADISEPTIKLVETGKVRATETTMRAIRDTFEQAGVEFIEGGVRYRNDTLRVIEKKSAKDNIALRLLDDMYYTCQENRDDVLYSFVDNTLSPPEVLKKEALIRDLGVRMRHLTRYGDLNFHYDLSEYKWLPDGAYVNSPTVVYGHKFAVFIPSYDEGSEKIVIIHNPSIAAVKRAEFEIIWNHCESPKKIKGNKS